MKQIVEDINLLGYRKNNKLYTCKDVKEIILDSIDPEERKFLEQCLKEIIRDMNREYIKSLNR